MSLFTDVRDAVYGITKRPDLAELTRTCIYLATTRAHHVDFFPRDKDYYVWSYTPSNTLPYETLSNLYAAIPRLRAVDFLQSVDPATFALLETLKNRSQDDLVDEYGALRRSVYTIIGSTVRAYPLRNAGRFEIFHYKNPDVSSESNYYSWIAETHKEEVAHWAAGILFSRLNNTDQAELFARDHVMPFKQLLTTSYLLNTVN